MPLSTKRWHAAMSEGESWTARAPPLQRSSSRISRGAVALRSQSDGSICACETGWLWPLRMVKRVSEKGATRGGKRRNTAAYGHGISLGAFRMGVVVGVREAGLASWRSYARRLVDSAARRLDGPGRQPPAHWPSERSPAPEQWIYAAARDRITKPS